MAQARPATGSAPTTTAADSLPAVTNRTVRDTLLAQAEAARKDQRWTDALAIYEHLLAANPRDDVAYRMQALTLDDVGAPFRADELRARWASDFPDYERDLIQGDRVAHEIGWGLTYPDNLDDPNAELRRAYDAALALQAQPGRTHWEQTRLRMDMLTATNGLGMYQKTIDEYEALKREGVDLPAYAHGPAADSYLALHHPKEAQAALEQALAKDPNDVDTQILLGYSYIEQERFDLALPMMQKLAESQPAWIQRPGAESDQANWKRYRAEMAYAQMISFGDDNARAQSMIEPLLRMGPNRSNTQAAFGALMYRRGHPTAALERYDMALTMDPHNRDAEIARVSALYELGRVDEAMAANDQVQKRYPKNLHAERLQEELDWRNGPMGSIDFINTRNNSESPNGSPFGVREHRLYYQTWSPLLGYRWRFGIVGDTVDAHFDPDTVRYRRIGAGIDYRYRQFGFRVSGYQAEEPTHDNAWTVDGAWYLNDSWTLHGQVADNDVDTSLQARRAGYKADSWRITANWHPSDTVAIDMNYKHLDYSDGNNRDQLWAYGRTRLYTSPRLMIDGLGSLWTSRGSRDDSPYFNPSQDAMATVGVRFNHLIWRHYDAYLRQKLTLEAGPYWQEGFGTNWVPSISYYQEWRPAMGHTFTYGVFWARPVYDGGRERRVGFEAAYRWGF
ncbi:biofilm PGA synthesis protein PgaA [Lysobacter sp. HA35]